MTFVEQYQKGMVTLTQLDEFIKRWREEAELTQPLSNFLGMTEAQYRAWVDAPSQLATILLT